MRTIPYFAVAALALAWSSPAHSADTATKTKRPAKKARSKPDKAKRKAPAKNKKSDGRYLERKAVEKVVGPDVNNIAACYKRYAIKQRRATGALRVEVIVHKDGFVKKVSVYAPGVKGKRLGRCVFKFAKRWLFPARKFYTRLAIPFFIHRKKVKGAGPVYSCWSAKGCPTHRRKARKTRKQRKTKKPIKPTPKGGAK